MRRSGASNSLLLGELAYPALEGREDAVSIGEETLRSLVTDICTELEAVVLVNSHLEPEQVWTLREVASA
jgi:hypothetical protein